MPDCCFLSDLLSSFLACTLADLLLPALISILAASSGTAADACGFATFLLAAGAVAAAAVAALGALPVAAATGAAVSVLPIGAAEHVLLAAATEPCLPEALS